jgi:hypothetical protein
MPYLDGAPEVQPRLQSSIDLLVAYKWAFGIQVGERLLWHQTRSTSGLSHRGYQVSDFIHWRDSDTRSQLR